ncbi:MAG: hypothetical protein ACTJHK_02540 [Enterococcus viikkiensis]|uniref:hypothetical protein n=1 Tax=Enterococcus viikkiensis TaxID=930854 RepID=UPI003F8E514A
MIIYFLILILLDSSALLPPKWLGQTAGVFPLLILSFSSQPYLFSAGKAANCLVEREYLELGINCPNCSVLS